MRLCHTPAHHRRSAPRGRLHTTPHAQRRAWLAASPRSPAPTGLACSTGQAPRRGACQRPPLPVARHVASQEHSGTVTNISFCMHLKCSTDGQARRCRPCILQAHVSPTQDGGPNTFVMKAGEPSSNTRSAQLTFARSQAVHSSARLSTRAARLHARGSARRLALRQLPAFTNCRPPDCLYMIRACAGMCFSESEVLLQRVPSAIRSPPRGESGSLLASKHGAAQPRAWPQPRWCLSRCPSSHHPDAAEHASTHTQAQ